ncbi:acyl-CoA dehydrogenase [Rhodococcus sp. WS4]|nr:acyl-CoA dehydrogenase [Rhodococcus sp. WS4]
MTLERELFDSEHEAYRQTVRKFLAKEIAPHHQQWETDQLVDRRTFEAAGALGILGLAVPTKYGGGGETDFRFRVVVEEEIARAGLTSFGHGIGTHDDIVLPYFVDLATEEQKVRWLPGLAQGSKIGAIAMTEPDAGSDLRALRTTAVRDEDDWIINGQKTFISNGILADLVVVVARTHPDGGSKGFSLFVVERETEGFERGRKLEKVGRHAQDTAELAFRDVRVPGTNLLGTPGRGLAHLMERLPRERMLIAVGAMAAIRAAVEWTNEFAFQSTAFGKPIGDLQNTRFVLADMATELDVTQAFIDRAVKALNAGTLTAVDAAKAKLWTTELQKRVIDRCVQIFGGYGYMIEYPIARAFIDSRAQTIYGGTSEIMREIIGRDIAAAHVGAGAHS